MAAVMVAQYDNYKSGYIVTLEKDTVLGWIDFRTDKDNSEICRFATDIDAKPTNYHPGEIAGYRFSESGKYYVSHEITVDSVTKKVFLEYLLQGLINLYYYHDGTQMYFGFENQDGEMTVVTKKPDYIDGTNLVSDKKYVGYVTYIFRDYQPIVQQTKSLGFNQRSFINIAKKYHNEVCTTGEECIVFENQHPDKTYMDVSLSLHAGVRQFTYVFSTAYDDLAVSNVSPAVGFGVNLKNSRWSQSWSLQLDATVSKHEAQTDKDFREVIKGNKLVYEKYNRKGAYSYQSNVLIVNIGAKYEYPKYNFRPVAEAGFSILHLFQLTERSVYGARNNDLPTKGVSSYIGLGFDYRVSKKEALILRVMSVAGDMNVLFGYAF
ncbi:MAG: hypothetical protein LBV75_06555 [Paludibacter sp.]|nr:hypothetical protein [Paludibacter sp.]